jgi:hypothetical protein
LLIKVKPDWQVGENVKKPDDLIVETVSNPTICASRISVATSFTTGCVGRAAADSCPGTTVRKSDNSYSYIMPQSVETAIQEEIQRMRKSGEVPASEAMWRP